MADGGAILIASGGRGRGGRALEKPCGRTEIADFRRNVIRVRAFSRGELFAEAPCPAGGSVTSTRPLCIPGTVNVLRYHAKSPSTGKNARSAGIVFHEKMCNSRYTI